jgi:pimeloyl-ACP methyl ester carboxylesterase
MPYVNVRGIDLYYEVRGDGEPLVLVHNGLGCARSFAAQVKEFSKHSTVIAYDRRGYGRSTHIRELQKNWLEASVEELAFFLDQLKIEKAQLCGVCVGGAIALLFGARNPERTARVVVAGTSCYGEETTLLKALRVFPSPEELPADWLQELVHCHGRLYARKLYRIFYKAIREENGYPFKGYDLRPILPRVECPVMVVYGDRDPLFDFEQALIMYRHLPDADLCIIPRCGHLPNEERPQDFNREVLSFIHQPRTRSKPRPLSHTFVAEYPQYIRLGKRRETDL